MPTYLISIYGVEEQWAAMSEQEEELLTTGHRRLAADAGAAIRFTGELDPAAQATTLRSDGTGGMMIRRGTVTAQSAQVGGLYLMDAADDDAAIALAANLHEARAGHSAVEVRRVAG